MARTSPRRTTPPPGSSTFCYWVKRWRSYLGVTQRGFSELWGVSLSLVQKIEADDYSVSQLSFERLETLRTLLKLPSSTFYGLIATHPDVPPEHPTRPAEGELVKVERLEPNLPPVLLPKVLLGGPAGTSFTAFFLTPTDFATDSLRDNLNVGLLVVFDRARPAQKDDVRVAFFQHRGQSCRVLLSGRADDSRILRSFDSERGAGLETRTADLEPLGVVVAYWINLA